MAIFQNTCGTAPMGETGSDFVSTRRPANTKAGRSNKANSMHFSTDWLNEAPNAAPEEAATACDLRVFVGVTNVTTHLDEEEGRVEDHVTMPAFSLALGLAMGWWRIFGGRHGDYSLLRHRMGYAVPDLRFRFDGLTFEASAEQKLYENP